VRSYCCYVCSFCNSQIPLLIATDVAARGLDIPDVEVRFACLGKALFTALSPGWSVEQRARVVIA